MHAYDSAGGYGTRRKRNLDLSEIRDKKPEDVTGIWWGDEKKVTPEQDGIEWDRDEEDIEDIDDPSPASDQQVIEPLHAPEVPVTNKNLMNLNGKPIRFQGSGNEKSFEETHVRFTSYLEHELFLVVKALKKQGHIRSITELVNESIKHYLTCAEA